MDEERFEECGCGLWICRECRPENFDPALAERMRKTQTRVEELFGPDDRRHR